jgi:DNA-nicking Smr family endonuclease
MVWNKDLAKLKQELKAEDKTDPKHPVPKPMPKPAMPRELGDEDALFLAAMGGARRTGPQAPDGALEGPPPPRPVPEKADFTEAMATLKGLKPVPSPKIPLRQEAPDPLPPPVPVEPEAPVLVPPEVVRVEVSPQPESARWSPALIQLAAGMAIEVDGTLDLRGHTAVDAMERLKERILDGHLLGWRTLHIQFGASEDLKQALLDYLAGPEANLIARYAQAPIPMGGAQAWILYLGLQGPATH